MFSHLDIEKNMASSHICRWTRTIFGRTQLDPYGKFSDKYRKNPTNGLGDVIMRKSLQNMDGRTPHGPLLDKLYLSEELKTFVIAKYKTSHPRPNPYSFPTSFGKKYYHFSLLCKQMDIYLRKVYIVKLCHISVRTW